MKTSVIEVRGMLSALSAYGVEKRIGMVPGVKSVTVNYAAKSATVRYDETRLEVADIKSAVRQRGYESAASAETCPGRTRAHACGAEIHARSRCRVSASRRQGPRGSRSAGGAACHVGRYGA